MDFQTVHIRAQSYDPIAVSTLQGRNDTCSTYACFDIFDAKFPQFFGNKTCSGFFFETKLGILVQMASPLQHGIGKFIGNQTSILTFSSGYDVDRKLTQIQGLREFLQVFATIPAF
jgi:hypothetical protein